MLPITYIEWTDCHTPNSGPWVPVNDPENATDTPLTIVTIGYVFRDNAEYVSLAASADLACLQMEDFGDEAVAGIMHIPQSQVRYRKELASPGAPGPRGRAKAARK